MPGPCTARPLNILHFIFCIQKQENPSHTLIILFLFLFKNLSMQNLNLCKTHRFTELLVIRSPMPIYIRKKNVEIFKLYQNRRNDVQFNSSLRKKEKKKVIFFFFSFFVLLTNKLKKIEKRKSISVFPFSFYLQKYTKTRKTKT